MVQGLTFEEAQVVFDYLFGKINKWEVRKLLPSHKEVFAKVNPNKGYFYKNAKLYLWALANFRKGGQQHGPGKFLIQKEDVADLRAIVLPSISTKYPVLTLKQFELLADSCLMSILSSQWIGKFISKKLVFLNRFGLSRNDIESSLREAGFIALCKKYPYYESELHAVNVCKAAMHNHAYRLVEYNTCPKRAVQTVSMDAFLGTFSRVSTPATVETDEWVNKQSLLSIESKLSPRGKLFLDLAQGTYNEEFSAILGKSNSDLALEMTYDEYLSRVRAFVRVSYSQQVKFFNEVKSKMVYKTCK